MYNAESKLCHFSLFMMKDDQCDRTVVISLVTTPAALGEKLAIVTVPPVQIKGKS